MWIFPVSLLLLTLAVILLWISAKQSKAAGLPGGRVIYSDTQKWCAVKEPFYAPELGLTGKPDYLVNLADMIIPVEVKSSHSPYGPYDSHIFQLAAYCVLIEWHFHKRPSHGILHYQDRTYRIEFTPQLADALKEKLVDMRSMEHEREVHRSHQTPIRCRSCGYRSICPEKLS